MIQDNENNCSVSNIRRFEYVSRISNIINSLTESEKTKYIPRRSTKASAGYDFINCEPQNIQPKQIAYIKTGIKVSMSPDDVFILCNRSSNPKNKSLILINGIGVIDSDYYNNDNNEGEIAFAFYNMSDEVVQLAVGDKLGQGVFLQYSKVVEDTADNENQIRKGGFGSTGV